MYMITVLIRVYVHVVCALCTRWAYAYFAVLYVIIHTEYIY